MRAEIKEVVTHKGIRDDIHTHRLIILTPQPMSIQRQYVSVKNSPSDIFRYVTAEIFKHLDDIVLQSAVKFSSQALTPMKIVSRAMNIRLQYSKKIKMKNNKKEKIPWHSALHEEPLI